jgi:hypothetical protein
MMPAMPVSAVVFYILACVALAGGHRGTAGLAELRIFCRHARRDLHNVRDSIGAQPHGVGCTGLFDFGTGLGVGPVELIKQRAGQQRQPANKAYSPHIGLPPVLRIYRAEKITTALSTVVSSHEIYRMPPVYVSPCSPKGGESTMRVSGGIKLTDVCGRQCSPQAKPLAVLRSGSRAMLSGQRSMLPSMISEVALSKDMCRQNFPSGIAETKSPVAALSRAAITDRNNGSIAA